MGDLAPKQSVVKAIKQSPPVDLSIPYDSAWLKGKHIIVTGGASGFGAGFVKEWAQAGASIILADVNVQKGDQTVRAMRKETGNDEIHFVACDVRDWEQQVHLFKQAVQLSPHGGIDIVVANAGIAGIEPMQSSQDLSAAFPEKPDFKVIDVNLYGVLYTTRLALYYLQNNPGSTPCSPDSDPAHSPRDRMLLLVGSLASLSPIPSQPLYGTAKHGVLGLFRTLRASSFVDGVRVNMICPYFIETPIMPAPARLLLAGGAMGQVVDVVDAATRLVADSRICGRALCIGPKVRVVQREEDGEWVVVPRTAGDVGEGESKGTEMAIWEAYAEDFVDTELFTQRIVAVLKGVSAIKGWSGWVVDIVKAIKYGIFG